MVTIRVVGIDASTKATGLVLPDGSARTIRPHAGAGDPARRLHQIVTRIDTYIKACAPDLAVIEGYYVGKVMSKQTCLRLGELGGAIRCRLFELDVPFAVVDPNQLKQYATGSGSASKDDMVAAASVAGFTVANDDEADAVWLHAMGRSQFSECWEPAFRGVELLDVRAKVRAAIRWPALEGTR